MVCAESSRCGTGWRRCGRSEIRVQCPRRAWTEIASVFFFKQKTAYEILTVTGVQTCALPISTHSSRLLGSLTKQLGHNGLPCSSRVAGSRTAAQRLQGTALAFAAQLRQIRSPSRSLLNTTTRAQRGQAGRLMPVAPAAHSASISRSTIGNGACAPSPVSSPGAWSMAHASLCSGRFDDGGRDRRRDRVGTQPRIQTGDDLDQDPARVTLVVIRALIAPWSAVSVAEGDVPLLPTRGARLRTRETR